MRRLKKRFRVWPVLIILLAATATLFVLRNCFQFAVTEGGSMAPTVSAKEVLVINKISQVQNGDIIAFYSAKYDRVLIKRVIAMEGDSVRIQDGKVFRNDIMLVESYLPAGSVTTGDENETIIQPGRYYVMGDNRPISQDSRSSSVGTVDANDVIGSVILRIWPLKNFQIF